MTCLPFLPIKYQWIPVMGGLSAVSVGWVIVRGVRCRKVLDADPLLLIFLLIHIPVFLLGSTYTSETDGVKYWLEHRSEFVSYVSREEYFQNNASNLRGLGSISLMFSYIACRLRIIGFLNLPNAKIMLCLTKIGHIAVRLLLKW